jgi:HAD superfamily hydrolase (TIGR01509 family)
VWSAVAGPSVIRAGATDLVALPMLALAWRVSRRAAPAPPRSARLARAFVLLPLPLFATAATSQPEYRERVAQCAERRAWPPRPRGRWSWYRSCRPGPRHPPPAPAGRLTGRYAAAVGELAAVLFDMDGTLVDSEKIWQAAIDDLAARLSGELPTAARKAMVGTTTEESIDILLTALDQRWRDPVEAGRWLETRVKELFAAGVSWRPGARELLGACRSAGIPTALVTATVGHVVEVMLGTLGRHNFDAMVTDDDVVNGKPHPEPYALAAAKLGVQTRDCVAIEDSPTGIASALAAGCAVVAVPAEVDLSALAGVTHVTSLTGVTVDTLRALVTR